MFKMLAKSRTEVAVQAAFSIDGSYDLWNSDVAFQLHTKMPVYCFKSPCYITELQKQLRDVV